MAEEKQEVRVENEASEYRPLEVPEVIPGAAPADFPEISDYLKNMRLKNSLFGFQKEDVYAKMQELNRMYQNRTRQLREQTKGQLRQMKRQHQEDVERLREELENRLKAEIQAEMEAELERRLEAELERAREEIRCKLEEERQEEMSRQRRELTLIGTELERLVERLTLLKNKVGEAAKEE